MKQANTAKREKKCQNTKSAFGNEKYYSRVKNSGVGNEKIYKIE